MKDNEWIKVLLILNVSLLMSFNIFFFVFVHYTYDLSPNYAVAFITGLFSLFNIITFCKLEKEKK